MIPSTVIRFKKSISISPRLDASVGGYLLSLALEGQKHSLTQAAKMCGIHPSQFSRLLKNHPELPIDILLTLSQKRSKKIRRLEKRLNDELKNAPWTTAIIIDSTLHQRSQLKGQNVQRFNNGGGFVIGHRWTNVCLFISGHLIPLPPIEFLSRNQCRKAGLPYQTEHEKVVQFLSSLELELWIGPHNPQEIVLLMDSGYDSKKIQTAILARGWDFIIALKSLRNSWITNQNSASLGSEPQWMSISKLFRRFKSRAPRATVKLPSTHGSKQIRVYDSRRLEGKLFGVPQDLTLLASKKRGIKEWKYFACSRAKLHSSILLGTYQVRFHIEQFHKDTKQYLGMEHAGLKHYSAVKAHVHWVYCTYLLLHDFHLPLVRIGTRERQKMLTNMHQSDECGFLIQLSSRINGAAAVKEFCREKIEVLYAA